MIAPSSNGAPGGVTLTGVTMELAGTRGPATVVPGVTLTVGTDGLGVTPPPPADLVIVGWSSIGWARCGEAGILSDGSPAVAVAAIVAGRLVRWLVPEAQMPPGRVLAIDHLLDARSASMVTSAVPVPTSAPTRAPVPPPIPIPISISISAHGARSRSRSRRPIGILLGWLAILLLVLVGGALAIAESVPATDHHRGHHPAPPARRSAAQAPGSVAQGVARSVTLRLSDLPTGWTAASTPAGPLSGFIAGDLASTTSTTSAKVARRYERCLGVRTAQVPLVSGGPAPIARSTSGAFAGPSTGAPTQVASVTAVYATSTPVRRAVAQLDRGDFASCFSGAVGDEFAQSAAASAPSGVTAGKAAVQALPLPRWAGIRATGVDLKLPLNVHGDETSVQLGFVFVTGARIESTLVSFSTTAVPESISQALTAVLEEEVAAAAGAS